MRLIAGLLASLVLCYAGAAAAQFTRESECGWVFPVEAYRADIAGLEIVLSANDRLAVRGRVVTEHHPSREDEPPASWRDSANTAEVALAADEVVVRTTRTDCIDYASTRIYVIDHGGSLRAEFALPWPHDPRMLNYEGRALVLRSDAFCRSGGEIAPDPAQAYVYVLAADGHSFVREARQRGDVCSSSVDRSVNQLHFMSMQPVTP